MHCNTQRCKTFAALSALTRTVREEGQPGVQRTVVAEGLTIQRMSGVARCVDYRNQ